jgi:hypothetical protein
MARWRDSWVRAALATAESDAKSLSRNHGDWAGPGQFVGDEDPLWRQYVTFIDLYKFYLEIAWKVTAAYYVGSGVALAYFFTNVGHPGAGALPLMLIFISVASFGFAFLMWRGARHVQDLTEILEYIATSLRLPGRPHVEFITSFLLIDAVIFSLVGVASLVLFIPLAGTVQLS